MPKDKELTIKEERVREVMKDCPTVKRVMETLWPELKEREVELRSGDCWHHWYGDYRVVKVHDNQWCLVHEKWGQDCAGLYRFTFKGQSVKCVFTADEMCEVFISGNFSR